MDINYMRAAQVTKAIKIVSVLHRYPEVTSDWLRTGAVEETLREIEKVAGVNPPSTEDTGTWSAVYAMVKLLEEGADAQEA